MVTLLDSDLKVIDMEGKQLAHLVCIRLIIKNVLIGEDIH